MTVNHRESYNISGRSDLCFNDESPRRGLEFVTRKVTDHLDHIPFGLADKVKLGSLEAQRDWGFAEDYVKAVWLALRQGCPES